MAGSVPARAGRIFISYRREETAYPAGWLYDRLADHFGSEQVFKDVDSIELGDDFVEVITSAVGSCDVLLAVIGQEWLTITDAHGRRRLDNPDDFVRLEIEAALSRRVRVIPILVDGARMPRAEELPDSLAMLERRQALELSPARFAFDTARLLKVLDRTLAELWTTQEDAASMQVPGKKAPEPSATELPKAPERPEQTKPRPTPSLPPATPATTRPAAGSPTDHGNSQVPVAQPVAGVGHRAAPHARVNRLLLVAGQLAIVGAALLVAGVFPAYEHTDSLWRGRTDVVHMRWYALYALTLAVLAVGAGACSLIPRTRRLIGPGLVLAIVAASTWGLLFLISDRLRNRDVSFGDGWRLELVAHLVLVVSACLTGFALARTAEVRLERRLPQGELAWLVVLLGGVGALALFLHDQNLWRTYLNQPNSWYVVPSMWMTVMALMVPTCAAVAVPRQFGVALLAGWIGGAAAFFVFHYWWDSYQHGGGIGRNPIITFGCTLLALLVVTVLFARAGSGAQVDRTI